MHPRGHISRSDPENFIRHIANLREELKRKDPYILALNTGCPFERNGKDRGRFQFKYWYQLTYLEYPDGVAYDASKKEALVPIHQAILLYYFNKANGVPLSSRWVSFSELPDGRFYVQAFQGYTGDVLAHHFRDDIMRFEAAARRLQGEAMHIGSLAFMFQILPFVPLLVVFWQGDEDFPSKYQILFDASAKHYLPTDGYAILGSMLTHKLTQPQNPMYAGNE